MALAEQCLVADQIWYENGSLPVITSDNPRGIRFDPFEMDLAALELRKNGRKIKLQEQPFRILQFLALRAKEPILREELYAHLSNHSDYDSKHGLDNAVQRIRKALGDSAENPRFIETLRGRGYRFLKEVEFIPDGRSNRSDKMPLTEGLFLSTVKRIRGEFLATNLPQDLSELFHRLSELLNQYSEHPDKSEAYVLLESIQSARSQQNLLNHKVSFESATLAFEDPHALSIFRPSPQAPELWHTLGLVQKKMKLFARPVILLVNHQSIPNQVGQPKNWVLSARKATPIERAAYEQAEKKTDS